MASSCGNLRCFLGLIALAGIATWASGCSLMNLEGNAEISGYRKASPGVVNVSSTIFVGDMFIRASGSGFVVDSRGYVVTNYHLVKTTKRIDVVLSDGSAWPGSLAGGDTFTNLAVLKVAAPPELLHPLSFGRGQDLELGRKVLALGNPFGEGETLSAGIISARERLAASPRHLFVTELIQTDASINKGNTGGPLVDSRGRVLGVNTAITPGLGGDEVRGYAVPVDIARRVVADLIEKGYASHPWIGARFGTLFPALARALNLEVAKGILVVDVFPGGPAELAGLRGADSILETASTVPSPEPDVVTAFDGGPVTSIEGFYHFLMRKRPGDRVTLRVLREGHFLDLSIALEGMPP